MVLNPRRRNVNPDVIALNAGLTALLCESLVNLRDPLVFGTAGEAFAERADVHVFEVTQYSAGSEKSEVCGDEFINERCGEVVERQSGDDEVELAAGFELLKGDLMNDALVPAFCPGRL